MQFVNLCVALHLLKSVGGILIDMGQTIKHTV